LVDGTVTIKGKKFGTVSIIHNALVIFGDEENCRDIGIGDDEESEEGFEDALNEACYVAFCDNVTDQYSFAYRE